MGNLILRDLQQDLKATTKIARDSIDLWLKDQDLYLSKNRKNKIALLLVRYLNEKGGVTQERVMNLLGNLGGGHFDFDNTTSVEIEIQRLLGYTKGIQSEADRRFYHKAILIGLIAITIVGLSVVYLTIEETPRATKPPIQQKASLSQHREIERQMDAVTKLRAERGLPIYSHEEAYRILGTPIGITDPDEMTEAQYTQLRALLQSLKIEMLKQKI